MRSVDNEIAQGVFRRVYLIYGKEHYLLAASRNRLLEALGVTDTNDMNYSRFDENNFSVDALIADADTLPFFADRRVILVSGSGYFKGNRKDRDRLISYIPEIPQTTVIVFVESDVDKKSALYKAVAKNGTAEEYVLPSEKELMEWISGRLNADGIRMRRDAWNEFYLRTGSSMDLMDAEYEKLSAYCLIKKTVEKEDVEAICVNASETKVFAITDALANRNAQQVFDIYRDMIRQNEPAPVIFSLIERQLMQLYRLKQLEKDGASQARKMEAVGVKSEWVLRKLSGYQKKFTGQELSHLLECAEEYEEDYKRSRMKDSMAVEMLILEALKQNKKACPE